MCGSKSDRAVRAVLLSGPIALFGSGCTGIPGKLDSPAGVEAAALSGLQQLAELGGQIVSVGPGGIGACVPTPKPRQPSIDRQAARLGFAAAEYIAESREKGAAPNITFVEKCETVPPD